jgi:uncharacterized protein with HEPN domain
MRRDRLLLTEIMEAVERIIDLTDGHSLDDFESDRDRRDALLWNFTVLGEAVGQLSDETKDAHPGVAWMAPIRMRNRIVHGYWSIDLDVLLATAGDDLPGFAGDVRAVLAHVSSIDGHP